MTSTVHQKAQLSVLMDEYKALSDDIGRRVQLQQLTINVGIVLLTAFAGYLFNYWNRNSLDELKHGELVCLVVLAPLLGMVSIWRHVDHDSNIFEKASYVEDVIRPKVATLTGDPDILGFERYLRQGRFKRLTALSPLAVLGMEHVALSAFITTYGVAGWYLRLGVSGHAGQARHLFDWLLYVDTVLYVISMGMVAASTYRYTLLGKIPESSGPSSAEPTRAHEPRVRRGDRPLRATPPSPKAAGPTP